MVAPGLGLNLVLGVHGVDLQLLLLEDLLLGLLVTQLMVDFEGVLLLALGVGGSATQSLLADN